MRKVLVMIDWFTPGYKAGGPIQSCRNIIKTLSGRYQFYVLTSDRDLGEEVPYQGIALNTWVRGHNNEKIFYSQPGFMRAGNIRKIIEDVQPDIIYFNSMFSQLYTLAPLWVLRRMNYKGKVLLAPRGMLHTGAMTKKGFKKKLFLQAFSLSGWPRKIVFHATDEQERNDIRKYFPKAAKILVTENVPNTDEAPIVNRNKEAGTLHMVFISRIHSKKNLHFILRILASQPVKGHILFNIYGEADDMKYTEECQALARMMPANIQVNFEGPLPHTSIFDTLHQYHLFVLPTLGENFGHAIFEALSSGTPVLISDQTPWRNLTNHQAGWDISLLQPDIFREIIEKMLQMDQPEYETWATGARKYAEKFVSKFDFISKYTTLFQ